MLPSGRVHGVPLPATVVVDQLYAAREARGQGHQDHSGLLTPLEDRAAHRIGACNG